jgi:hypothetical protein
MPKVLEVPAAAAEAYALRYLEEKYPEDASRMMNDLLCNSDTLSVDDYRIASEQESGPLSVASFEDMIEQTLRDLGYEQVQVQ